MNAMELLGRDGFEGIILSRRLVEKLRAGDHPFLKISIANELLSLRTEGASVESTMSACVIHEDGWGFTSFDDANTTTQ